MQTKKPSDSAVEIAQVMMPEDANPAGNVFGGVIMKIIDQAAGIVASRHTHSNVVTASVDRIDFLNPAFIGNVVFAKASMNYVGRTSMEIGVRVEDECLITGARAHIASAYLTYVALDSNDEPLEVPLLEPQTKEEKRRFEEAKKRKEKRMKRIPDEVESKSNGQCIQRPNKIKKK
ncbi:MAG: acyl-CoA thioesterase [Candidatus Lokiarchaeota archaeon]|nr:acyl-CoA thioesterase [Candidatus Lokiarchaeota archaeon]MBD3202013.1 acyl-CoA thioesterase [Candidatus Lokiarchaeota archaeon]